MKRRTLSRGTWVWVVTLMVLVAGAAIRVAMRRGTQTTWDSVLANLATELAGIVVTYLLIQRLVEGRERRETEEAALIAQKADLIAQMGSQEHAVAIRATEELRRRGWLADGSLRGAILVKANLARAPLDGASLKRANLGGANLTEAHLIAAHLEGAILIDADLTGADLRVAHLEGAFLIDADLTGAILFTNDLTGAHLKNANLKDAKVSDKQLAQAKSLEGATMPNGTLFEGTMEEFRERVALNTDKAP